MPSIDGLIMEVHEAALNPDYFEELCCRISDLVGGGSVHLMLTDLEARRDHVSLFTRGDQEFSEIYSRDYMETDFRVPRVLARRPGKLIEETSYVSADEARRSEIHQSLLPHYDIHNIVGSNLGIDGAIGWFGISSLCEDRPFDAGQIEVLSRLTPHLLLAFKTLKANSDLGLSRALLTAALDSVNGAVLILSRGKVAFANVAAERLMADGFFRLSGGRLVCRAPSESRRIVALQTEIDQGGDGQLVVRDRSEARAYHLRIRDPFPAIADGTLKASAERIVTISELVRPVGATADEAMHFGTGQGLTPRENAVVAAVLTHTSLRQFAEENDVALNTAQKQLKSAMARIGIASQKALFQAFERYRLLGGHV